MQRTYNDIDATLKRSKMANVPNHDPRVKATHRMKRSLELNGNNAQRLLKKLRRQAPTGSSSQINEFKGANITVDERPKPVMGQKTTVLYHFVLKKRASQPQHSRFRAGDVVHTTSRLWAHTSPLWSWNPDNTIAIYAIRVSHEWLMETLAKNHGSPSKGNVYFGSLYPRGENDERAYGTIVLPAFVARVRKVRSHDLTLQGVKRFIDHENYGRMNQGRTYIPYITLDMVGIKSARAVPSRIQPVGGRTYLYTLPDRLGSVMRIENPSKTLRQWVMRHVNSVKILDDNKITFKKYRYFNDNGTIVSGPNIDDVLRANFPNNRIVDGIWNVNSVNGKEMHVFHYARPHAVQGARSASARRGTKSVPRRGKSTQSRSKSASARRAQSV